MDLIIPYYYNNNNVILWIFTFSNEKLKFVFFKYNGNNLLIWYYFRINYDFEKKNSIVFFLTNGWKVTQTTCRLGFKYWLLCFVTWCYNIISLSLFF